MLYQVISLDVFNLLYNKPTLTNQIQPICWHKSFLYSYIYKKQTGKFNGIAAAHNYNGWTYTTKEIVLQALWVLRKSNVTAISQNEHRTNNDILSWVQLGLLNVTVHKRKVKC